MGSRYRDLVGDSAIEDLPTVNKRDLRCCRFYDYGKAGLRIAARGPRQRTRQATQPESSMGASRTEDEVAV